jgi:hypothetical protein
MSLSFGESQNLRLALGHWERVLSNKRYDLDTLITHGPATEAKVLAAETEITELERYVAGLRAQLAAS